MVMVVEADMEVEVGVGMEVEVEVGVGMEVGMEEEWWVTGIRRACTKDPNNTTRDTYHCRHHECHSNTNTLSH